MNKNLTIAIGIVFVLAFSILFRTQIGRIISLGGNEYNQETTSPLPSESVTPSSLPSITNAPQVSHTPQSKPSQMPVYSGRPVDEVRPVSEEVKLFSEAQKQDIYNAIGNYGKAVKEKPDFFAGWLQLGLLKKNIGDFEGARDAWEYASVIRPLNDVSFANLGELYWRYLHQYAKSEINFKMAIKNNPNDPGTYASLSDLYFYSLKEKANLADDILFEGIAAIPKSTDMLKKLATLYERQGEYAKAIAEWQKLLVLDPQNTGIAAVIDALKKKLAQ